MNVLPKAKQAAILKALTEGTSVRATARMVGVSKTTVLKLLVEAGQLCAIYHDKVVRNLSCKRIQMDEIWAFVGAKQKNAKRDGDGDMWTYSAICADTKFMVSWFVGIRSLTNHIAFVRDAAARVAGRIQLSTDGNLMYLTAVEVAFGPNEIDYGMLIKRYEADRDTQARYSPPRCVAVESRSIFGNPDPKHISTSFIERSNLHLRMQSRRFTRLTNAFSRKVENHAHAVALHFMVYNFCRQHGTLTKQNGGIHTSPAMAAGLTGHVWKVEDLVGLLDPSRLFE